MKKHRFPLCALWLIGLIVAGFLSGCAVAASGYYLRAFTAKNEIGLSANVLGVLGGDLIGIGVASMRLSGAGVAVIAPMIVCLTPTLLPPLNRRLLPPLKSHAYLAVYDRMGKKQRAAIILRTKPIDPLTGRENEVLALLPGGNSNRDISKSLFIRESTVKTHVRSIFSNYDAASRAELISTLLKDQGNL